MTTVNKFFYIFMAELVLVLHIPIFLLLMFGWLIPSIYPIYMSMLVIDAFFYTIGYCPLTKWEFYFRKKLNPNLDYDFPFGFYYANKMTQGQVGEKFLRNIGIIFIFSSIVLNIGLRYFLRY